MAPSEPYRLSRSVVSVGSVFGKSDKKAFWLSKTPQERIEAMQFMREIAYGHDAATGRLQRVIEVADFPPR
jgi:hypothetical protein